MAATFFGFGSLGLQAAESPSQNSPTVLKRPPEVTQPNAADSATLQRILKNWKARQDRTKSLRMAWDSKLFPWATPAKGVAKNSDFRLLHNELWMDGENRCRVEQSFTRGRGYQLTRFGKTEASYGWNFGSRPPLVVDIWSAEDPPKSRGYDLGFEVDPRVVAYSMRAPWVALRPLVADLVNHEPDTFRLVAENKVVNNTHLVRITKTNPQTKTVEDYWVDPTRDDLIVLWDCAPPREAACSMSIESERDPDIGWIPSRWTATLGRGESPWMVAVNTVTAFATRAEYPPDALRLSFPEGAVIFDKRIKEQYTVGKNGSRTHVSKFNSAASLKIYAVLEQPVDFNIEPQPLVDVMAFVAARYEIRVRVDRKAFRESGIDLATEVAASAPGVPVRQVLQLLLEQFGRPIGFAIQEGELVVSPVARPQGSPPSKAGPPSHPKTPQKQ
ncbi:MAG TPA: hypothetical protein VGP63_20875 [Planctomycetaceae bacterium]|nr:hypothetical protein [Planctomycetaceae bacterium]